MAQPIPMQSINCSNLDQSRLCSFDLEVIGEKTSPLIHQSARFLLINGGRGKIRIQNVEYDLAPGALVAILPWQITEVVEVQAPLQYFLLVYRFDIVNQIIKSMYNVENNPVAIADELARHPVVYCSASQKERISTLFLAIRDEVGIESTMGHTRQKPLSGIYVMNALVEVVVLYLRVLQSNEDTLATPALHIDQSEILQYMYNHLSEKLTLKGLSQRFYMSESSISSYITRATGLSFFDLLNEMRVGKTISFLLYTDLTLDELAEILGYVDASHISKVFSARVGMKANEYRKTYQRAGEVCKVKESRKAYAVVAHMYRSYSEPLSAQAVAKEFSLSVPELHRTLMYQVEKNFEDFLNYIRVNRACELLLATRKTVMEVALEVGYRSDKTLTRNFLRLRHMTPGEFRKTVALQPGIGEAAPGDA